jgi:hypothetical protein
MKETLGKSVRYAYLLIGYPLSAFVLLKLTGQVFSFQPDKWLYFVVILIAHIFSLVYIVRGINEPQ